MNGKRTRRALLCFILLISACSAFLLTVSPAHAANPTLSVDPMDQPLKISRMLNNSTTTFGGNIRLTAMGGDIGNLRLLASDLQMMNDACPSTPTPSSTPSSQSASAVIDRSNISIPAGTSLKDAQPADVLVTITNVTHPGTYCGFLDFYDGQTGSRLLTVPLTLKASASPNVTSLDDTVTVQVVHNQWSAVDTLLVNIVLSNSYEQDKWTVRLLNQTLIPVNILGMTIDLKGDKTGVDFSPRAQDAFPGMHFPFSLPANQITTITFAITRDMLPPDHYHGVVRILLENSDTAVKVPIDVNLRNGPFWPIVLLILGIVLGRLAVNLYSATATKQNALRSRASDVSDELSYIKDSGARDDVATKLKDIKDKIYQTSKDDELTKLDNSLTKLEGRISFYRKVDTLEELINRKVASDEQKKKEFLDQVYELRRSMQKVDIDGEITAPEEKLAELKNQVDDWHTKEESDTRSYTVAGAMLDSRINYLAATRTEFDDLFTDTRESLAGIRGAETAPPPGQQQWWSGIAQFMRGLWGTQAQRAERRDVWLRPTMQWILVVVLALIGLQTLYITSGATFGAAGLFDYLPLFLWGFGSNVVGSSFQNLPLPTNRG